MQLRAHPRCRDCSRPFGPGHEEPEPADGLPICRRCRAPCARCGVAHYAHPRCERCGYEVGPGHDDPIAPDGLCGVCRED